MPNKSNQHPTLTGSEIIWATLAGEGTTTVFGYPGGAILSPKTPRATPSPTEALN